MILQEIREKIDLLDSRILRMLNKRMELALMAKKFKSRIEDSDREKELLDRIRRNSPGLINSEFIEKVFVEVLKESKKLQGLDHHLIAFQGEHGAYGEVACREWRGDYVPVPCAEFSDVFEGVQSGTYDFGIVPVENSLGGIVGEVNELLINMDLYVAGAIELPICLCLLSLPGSDHREIRTVYSQSQVLAQCRQFITRNRLQPIPYSGAAAAARMLADEMPKATAVIASKLAAEIYNLEMIKEDIEDFNRNTTRFLVLSKREREEIGDKCSIIFSTEHKAGTLFGVLEIFARENINLTRIGSVPGDKGDYVFFLDFLGSKKDDNVAEVLRDVQSITTYFRFLGSYKEKKVK